MGLFVEADTITINSSGAIRAAGANGGNGGNTAAASANFNGGAGATGFIFVEIVP